MHRLFGKKKEVPPPPTLADASGGLNARIATLDEKIKGLDNELRVYKTQMAKAKGPAKANLQKRAVDVLKRKRMYEQQRDQLAGQAFNIDQVLSFVFVLLFFDFFLFLCVFLCI
jgi:charged multivesicular body protein 5